MTANGYPARPRYFALHYLRLLSRVAAVNDVGLLGWAVLVEVVLTEDKRRYRSPPTFWTSSLSDRLCRGEDALRDAINRCVESGWLHWRRPSNRSAATAWVLIPEAFADEIECPENPGNNPTIVPGITRHSPGQKPDNHTGNRAGNNPGSPNPVPKPKHNPPTPPPPSTGGAGDSENGQEGGRGANARGRDAEATDSFVTPNGQADTAKVLELYREAVAEGVIVKSEANALRFFAEARYVARRTKAGKIREPIAVLRSNARAAQSDPTRWHASDDDDDAARKVLKQLRDAGKEF